MANNFVTDLSSYYSTNAASRASTADVKTAKSNGYDLSMEDFLQLMMVELQNQTIDDTADTGEMLNQMVQMQMVTALSNMTDTNIMTYASSLVGKEVTIGSYDSEGNLQENVITVIGTGLLNGYQVIFGSDGKTYPLNQIMAVGRLPDVEGGDGTQKPGDGTDKPGDVEKPGEGTNKPGDTDKPGDVEKPGEGEGTEKPGEGEGTDEVEKPGEGSTETPEVPDDRPTEGTGDTEDTTEDKKDDVVEPTQEVG